jgi:hypothetical protein
VKTSQKGAPKVAKRPKNIKSNLPVATPSQQAPSKQSIVAPGFVFNESLVIPPPTDNIASPLPIIGLGSPLTPLASIVGPVGPIGLAGQKGNTIRQD